MASGVPQKEKLLISGFHKLAFYRKKSDWKMSIDKQLEEAPELQRSKKSLNATYIILGSNQEKFETPFEIESTDVANNKPLDENIPLVNIKPLDENIPLDENEAVEQLSTLLNEAFIENLCQPDKGESQTSEEKECKLGAGQRIQALMSCFSKIENQLCPEFLNDHSVQTEPNDWHMEGNSFKQVVNTDYSPFQDARLPEPVYPIPSKDFQARFQEFCITANREDFFDQARFQEFCITANRDLLCQTANQVFGPRTLFYHPASSLEAIYHPASTPQAFYRPASPQQFDVPDSVTGYVELATKLHFAQNFQDNVQDMQTDENYSFLTPDDDIDDLLISRSHLKTNENNQFLTPDGIDGSHLKDDKFKRIKQTDQNYPFLTPDGSDDLLIIGSHLKDDEFKRIKLTDENYQFWTPDAIDDLLIAGSHLQYESKRKLNDSLDSYLTFSTKCVAHSTLEEQFVNQSFLIVNGTRYAKMRDACIGTDPIFCHWP